MILIIILLAILAWVIIMALITLKMRVAQKVKEEELEKEREKARENHREYHYYIHGLEHKNDEGKKVINLIKRLAESQTEYYKDIKLADFKENPFDDVYKYGDVVLNCDLEETTFEDKTAVRVYAYDDDGERHQAGWISASQAEQVADMLRKHQCRTWIEIEGGPYKTYGEDENGRDRMTIEQEDMFPVVYISYELDEEIS